MITAVRSGCEIQRLRTQGEPGLIGTISLDSGVNVTTGWIAFDRIVATRSRI